MRIIAIIAGVIHAFLPEMRRQMRINESDTPIAHLLINDLDLRQGRLKAAATPRPTPTPSSTLYIGGYYFERAAGA